MMRRTLCSRIPPPRHDSEAVPGTGNEAGNRGQAVYRCCRTDRGQTL
jgi:hypothetical protein